MPDVRLRPVDAARAVGVSPQLFNHWRSRGYLHPDTDGRYLLADVRRVERDMRADPRSTRRAA